jgi:hypothetical protein
LGGFPAARSFARQHASEPGRWLVIGNTELESLPYTRLPRSALFGVFPNFSVSAFQHFSFFSVGCFPDFSISAFQHFSF